ncbi:choice-of-anchor Q domain-containing protein [Bythopirellula goksoeyrii]|uniref:Right handed beta helix domain-containing protein n=1 Tax=Bythopirellula goksoeyrii TaxID=1400387 RepID=A0A5B9Q6H9_9BACT|nr:choice-of-anchor Q domain-containing protein [Bythopirellula goksoeyrii]QEG33135.1 hypothetical protein Pr1d_03960 [Bythopirellula goksoeyrii]
MLRWKSLLTGRLTKGIRRKQPSDSLKPRRLATEMLEDRRMLAAVSVSNVSEVVDGTVTSIGALISNPGTDGTISLREAILAANATTGADEITYDPIVFASAQTILVSSQLPTISDALTITGPTAGGVTLDADGGNYRIFLIDDADANNQIDVELRNLTLTGANLVSLSEVGGAIFNRENLTIESSTISGNSSSFGGGIHNYSGNLTIINSTLSGNSAAFGGAIFDTGSLSVEYSTITNNSATDGGGGIDHEVSDSFTISHSIVAGNTSPMGTDVIDVSGSVSGSFNLIGDGTGLTGITNGINGNMVGTDTNPIDPLLEPLADNGGPTLTRALQPTSPAIDMGDLAITTPPDFDQRGTGFDRVVNGRIDIGAFEVQIDPSLFIVTTLDDEQIDNGLVSLREAIANANNSAGAQEITFDPSLLNGSLSTLDLDMGELTITEALTITGPGANLLSIDADQGSRIFNIDGGIASDFDVTFAGLTLTGGKTTAANADRSDTTNNGGAIRSITTGDLTINDSSLSNNSVTGTYSGGGAIFALFNIALNNTTVSNNYTGGIHGNGGGFSAFNVTLTNSTVSGNHTKGAYAYGGGIHSYDSVTLTNSTVSGNYTNGEFATGGGVYSNNDTTLTNSTVRDNHTKGADAYGGGILAFERVILTNSTVSGNYTLGDRAYGGGFVAYGQVTLNNSTISGNYTTGTDADGGAIWAVENITLSNSTVSGNSTRGTGANGGGIWAEIGTTLNNSILAGNSSTGVEADLQSDSGDVTANFSLIGTGISPSSGGNNVVVDDPLLESLADNGGPTFTRALQPTSPAIDAGDPTFTTPPQFDQRGTGFPRVLDGNGDSITRIDIGAYEFPAAPPTPKTVSLDSSLNLVITDLLAGGANDQIDLSVVGSNLVIANPSQPMTTDISGASNNGPNELLIPLSAIVGGKAIVNSLEGDDTLSVKTSVTAAGLAVEFDGGTGSDGLAVMGTGTEIATYTPDASTTGDGVVDVGGREISFANLAPVDISGMITAQLNLPGANDILTVAEGVDFVSGGTNQALRVSGTSGGVTIESAAFWDNQSLRINTALGTDGDDTITISSAANAHLNQSLSLRTGAGNDHVNLNGPAHFSMIAEIETHDISLEGKFSATDYVELIASGAIVDAINNSDIKVEAQSIVLEAGEGVGTAANAIETATQELFTLNTLSGTIHVVNLGALEVTGLEAVGAAIIEATSPLTISGNITVGADSTFTATDSSAAGDDLTIASGVTIDANGSELTFNAGDNFDFAAGASIIDGANVTVNVDTPDADAPDVGSSVTVLGTITAMQLTLNGGEDEDSFLIVPSVDTPIQVNGGNPTTAPGDRLIVEQLGGIADAVVPAGSPTSGTISFSAGSHQAIMFTSIESLLAGIFVVDTLVDEDDGDFSVGDLSLREAIGLANSDSGPDRITFAPALNGGTIDLTLGELEITDELTIAGPGASLLTIDAQQDSRIFNISTTTGDFTIEGLTLTGGKTTGDNADFSDTTNSGGAIRSRTTGNLSINDSTITGNSTEGRYALGGGIYAYNVTLTNSTVSSNSTAGELAFGGGIAAYFNATLTNSTISGNTTSGASARGGGIYAYYLALTNSTVSGNSTTNDYAVGGGLNAYNVTLTNSTVSGNSTGGGNSRGGGLYASTATLTNSTVSGNSTAGIFSDGGGIFANNATVNHSTITDNHAMSFSAAGGGVSVGNDLSIDHSIIADNTDGGGNPDLQPGSGALSVDYSLIGDTSGTGINILTGTGNLLNIAADLFPLADNGGPTQTHIPMPTSPVIDAGRSDAFPGVDGVPEFDQRGIPFVRVRDGNGDLASRIDIGATEVENQLNGPQVIGLAISDNTSTVDVFAPKGPTLVGRTLEIKVRDLPPRSNAADAPAVDFAFASNKALYSLVGDHTGNIAIASVQVVPDPITVGQPATATIRLLFADPLPDDRFTLTVSDSVRDLDGNLLDGEWNAAEPLTPGFPSGDGVPGGDFVARFTIDSRPEIGVYGAGQIFIDANGNSTFDPNNADPSNSDLVFLLGYSLDSIFAGNFVESSADAADGFDKLAVYGRDGNQWRWQIDIDNDGLPDIVRDEPLNINGIPFAGNFDGDDSNGDEVGVFDGTSWYFDMDHDFQLDSASKLTISNLTGYPVVGDFNGDGFDDLGTYDPSPGNNQFSLALATGANTWSTTLRTSRVGTLGSFTGFAGVRERPVAADMNADGVDDLGLWVPDGSMLTPTQQAEWFFLLSDDDPTTIAVENSIADRFTAGGGFVPFSTVPFGNDLFFQFGNPYMLPIVGNFDPPVSPGIDSTPTAITRPDETQLASQLDNELLPGNSVEPKDEEPTGGLAEVSPELEEAKSTTSKSAETAILVSSDKNMTRFLARRALSKQVNQPQPFKPVEEVTFGASIVVAQPKASIPVVKPTVEAKKTEDQEPIEVAAVEETPSEPIPVISLSPELEEPAPVVTPTRTGIAWPSIFRRKSTETIAEATGTESPISVQRQVVISAPTAPPLETRVIIPSAVEVSPEPVPDSSPRISYASSFRSVVATRTRTAAIPPIQNRILQPESLPAQQEYVTADTQTPLALETLVSPKAAVVTNTPVASPSTSGDLLQTSAAALLSFRLTTSPIDKPALRDVSPRNLINEKLAILDLAFSKRSHANEELATLLAKEHVVEHQEQNLRGTALDRWSPARSARERWLSF